MKRFLIDALFVWLLLSLLMYMSSNQESERIDDKINEFEDEIARHERIVQKVETTRLNDIDENAASRLAQVGSDFVIDIMDSGITLLSDLIYGFMK